MFYITTTTAAPVWASTWATLSEVPTTTANELQSKRESRTARLLAVLKDYAAGTANSIKAHAKRTADSIAAPLLTIEADTLTADTLTTDTLTAAAPAADSIESEGTDTPAELLTADSEADTITTATPTDDTGSKADTITTNAPTDDTDPAAADSESDSDTQTDTTTSGHPHAHGSTPAAPAVPCSPSAPVAPIVIVCFGI